MRGTLGVCARPVVLDDGAARRGTVDVDLPSYSSTLARRATFRKVRDLQDAGVRTNFGVRARPVVLDDGAARLGTVDVCAPSCT